MSGNKKQVILGGVIKHNNGIGFKITFQDQATANKYKDMMRWIIKNDKHPVVYKTGYYDIYDKEGLEK
jgi:hypothetical protein